MLRFGKACSHIYIYTICTRSNDPLYKQFGRGSLYIYTVCPGSSDPPEKILNIFASENEFYTIFNYYDISGWILFVYRAK